MSIETEFEEQWDTLIDVIMPLMRRQLTTSGMLTSQEADHHLRMELDKWFVDGQFRKSWLDNIAQGQPEMAVKVRGQLEAISFGFPDIMLSDKKSLYAVYWGGGVAGGFALTRFFPLFRGVLGALATGGTAWGLALLLKQQYTSDRLHETDAHLEQVRSYLSECGRDVSCLLQCSS